MNFLANPLSIMHQNTSLNLDMLSGSMLVKNPPVNAGDVRDAGLIPESGKSPGEGHDNLLQYSCLENPMVRGARQATVHRVSKSWT